eukprot:scaffold24_cov341-Pavlova_lutheri.AAC.61
MPPKWPKGRNPKEGIPPRRRKPLKGTEGKARPGNPGSTPGREWVRTRGRRFSRSRGGSCLPSLDVWATSEGSDSREDESPAFEPR